MDKFTITYLPKGVTDHTNRHALQQTHYAATSMDRAVAQFREDMECSTPIRVELVFDKPGTAPAEADDTKGGLTPDDVRKIAARAMRDPARATVDEVRALADACLSTIPDVTP